MHAGRKNHRWYDPWKDSLGFSRNSRRFRRTFELTMYIRRTEYNCNFRTAKYLSERKLALPSEIYKLCYKRLALIYAQISIKNFKTLTLKYISNLFYNVRIKSTYNYLKAVIIIITHVIYDLLRIKKMRDE